MAHPDVSRHYLQEPTLYSGDFKFECAAGKVHGHGVEVKFGVNDGVGTAEEDIWEYGGKYPWPGAAEFLDIVSTDADDTDQGLGTWSVHVYGLDADWAEVNEVVVMNGLTPVRTVNQYIRVFRMHTEDCNLRVGQSGVITATNVVSGDVLGMFAPENNQTLQCIYTVPDGHVACVTSVGVSVVRGQQAYLRFWSKDNNIPNQSQRVRRTQNLYQSTDNAEFGVPYMLDQRTDLWVSARAAQASVNVTAEFSMILIDRNHLPAFLA